MWENIIILSIVYLVTGFLIGFFGCRIYKAIHFRFETDMETKREYDPNDPYSCECGNRHPLVERHGKCGSCWDKII
jgi:hypothetical protein